MLSYASFMQAAPAAAEKAATASSSPWGIVLQLAPFALLILVFYFLVLRPQNKKQKETKKMLESLKKGDKVVTIGGINGTVSSVKENTVIVKVDDACKIEFLRSAISTVSSREDSGADKSEGADKATSEPEKK